MQSCQCQFLFQLDDSPRERFLLGFKRGNFGSICRQLGHQRRNIRFAGSYYQILESEPPFCGQQLNSPSSASEIAVPDGAPLRRSGEVIRTSLSLTAPSFDELQNLLEL